MLGEFLSTHSEAAATIISVFAAGVVGILGYLQARRRHRREYTLSVLTPLLTNDRFFATHNIIIDHRVSGTHPTRAMLSDQQHENILQLLGYYEFLAAAFLRNDLDRKTVLTQRRSTFKGALETLKPFIEERRALLHNERVYCEFETFVNRCC